MNIVAIGGRIETVWSVTGFAGRWVSTDNASVPGMEANSAVKRSKGIGCFAIKRVDADEVTVACAAIGIKAVMEQAICRRWSPCGHLVVVADVFRYVR